MDNIMKQHYIDTENPLPGLSNYNSIDDEDVGDDDDYDDDDYEVGQRPKVKAPQLHPPTHIKSVWHVAAFINHTIAHSKGSSNIHNGNEHL